MAGAVNRDFWTCSSFADFVAGTALCEPRSADIVAGAVFCEPRSADFVAGTAEPRSADFVEGTALGEPRHFANLEVQLSWHALCEPHNADIVAGTALCEPRCADFVAGPALCEPRSADCVAGAALCEPRSADFVAGAVLCEPQDADIVAGAVLCEPQRRRPHTHCLGSCRDNLFRFSWCTDVKGSGTGEVLLRRTLQSCFADALLKRTNKNTVLLWVRSETAMPATSVQTWMENKVLQDN